MIFNKITPKLLRKVGRKTTFFMLQCVKNNCKGGNCMRATRRIYLERHDTKAFIRDKTRKLHFPVFDGCNHMQYQIRGPKGFAGMLEKSKNITMLEKPVKIMSSLSEENLKELDEMAEELMK